MTYIFQESYAGIFRPIKTIETCGANLRFTARRICYLRFANRESGRHVKDAAKNARDSVGFTSKLSWPFEEKPATPAVDENPKLSWVGGAKTTVEKEKHAVVRDNR